MGQVQAQSITQTVKAICAQLSSLETIQITESCTNFSQLCNAFGVYKRESNSSDDSSVEPIRAAIVDLDSRLWEILDNALVKLKQALAQLIHLYSITFPVDFDVSEDLIPVPEKKVIKDISPSMDTLLCNIDVCCQLQADWISQFKEFKVIIFIN